MQPYQSRLADLLSRYEAFRTGDFTLKSGAASPYFINFGRIDDGRGLLALGEVFADLLQQNPGFDAFDVVAGPAYKGIPLATAIAVALAHKYGANKGVVYNRKEKKAHSEDAQTVYIGSVPTGCRIMLVDDVFTSGETKEAMIGQLQQLGDGVKVVGLVVGVDRQQHPSQGGQDMQQFCQRLGIASYAVLSVTELLQELLQRQACSNDVATRVQRYLKGETYK